MLNLSNLPGEIVSGLSTDELAWVSSESSSRYLEELSEEFARRLQCEEIPDISDDAVNELIQLERDGMPKSSVRQMEDNTARFKEFLRNEKLSSDLLRVPVSILNNYQLDKQSGT